MLYVGITFSVCGAVCREGSLISVAELDEDTSSEGTADTEKLLEVTMVEENEAVETNERGQLVTVTKIVLGTAIGGVLLVGVIVPSEEIGSVLVGISVAV